MKGQEILIMQINDDWKLESDSMNYILYKRKQSKEETAEDDEPKDTQWKVMGYYGTVAYALQSMINKELLGTGMKDLQTINVKIEELKNTISKLPLPQRPESFRATP